MNHNTLVPSDLRGKGPKSFHQFREGVSRLGTSSHLRRVLPCSYNMHPYIILFHALRVHNFHHFVVNSPSNVEISPLRPRSINFSEIILILFSLWTFYTHLFSYRPPWNSSPGIPCNVFLCPRRKQAWNGKDIKYQSHYKITLSDVIWAYLKMGGRNYGHSTLERG